MKPLIVTLTVMALAGCGKRLAVIDQTAQVVIDRGLIDHRLGYCKGTGQRVGPWIIRECPDRHFRYAVYHLELEYYAWFVSKGLAIDFAEGNMESERKSDVAFKAAMSTLCRTGNEIPMREIYNDEWRYTAEEIEKGRATLEKAIVEWKQGCK